MVEAGSLHSFYSVPWTQNSNSILVIDQLLSRGMSRAIAEVRHRSQSADPRLRDVIAIVVALIGVGIDGHLSVPSVPPL